MSDGGYWRAWGLFLALFMVVLFSPFIVPWVLGIVFGFHG